MSKNKSEVTEIISKEGSPGALSVYQDTKSGLLKLDCTPGHFPFFITMQVPRPQAHNSLIA